MVADGAQMIGKRVAGSLAGLGHQVRDVHARRLGLAMAWAISGISRLGRMLVYSDPGPGESGRLHR